MERERLVRETWAALERGDYDAVERMFAPDARWVAVEAGPWDCESRTQIISVMRENRARGVLAGEVEQVLDAGRGRLLVAFRPAGDAQPGGWPLEDGLRWMVLSFDEEGLAREMKGCADRATALAYAAS